MKGPFFIFLLLMPAFMFLILLILLAMQYKQLKALVAPEPMALPGETVDPESRARVRAVLDSFLTAPKRTPGEGGDTLTLDAADINALIKGNTALERLRLDYHLSLEDTLLVARNSMPVENINGMLATIAKVLRVKGYLNSEMKGFPKLEEGKITLVPVSAVMNGVPAPASVLTAKGKIDLKEFSDDKAAIDRAAATLADIRIRGGKLLLIRG